MTSARLSAASLASFGSAPSAQGGSAFASLAAVGSLPLRGGFRAGYGTAVIDLSLFLPVSAGTVYPVRLVSAGTGLVSISISGSGSVSISGSDFITLAFAISDLCPITLTFAISDLCFITLTFSISGSGFVFVSISMSVFVSISISGFISISVSVFQRSQVASGRVSCLLCFSLPLTLRPRAPPLTKIHHLCTHS
ncbi:MAG: hypothetical protein LBU08_00055 [Tannerellaceae bacterium]|jgi:hypothetical protein|nr:hypothetical protein [Tannerellaceae bacterium]